MSATSSSLLGMCTKPATQADDINSSENSNGDGKRREIPSVYGEQTLSKRAQKKMLRIQKWQKDKKKKSKKNDVEPGFSADFYDETDYYLENGLRKVYPYYYTYSTYVKRRWLGRTILDVFSSEFRAYTVEEYIDVIEKGLLTVNGQKVSTDFILKDNQLLEHRTHRHENPVTGAQIEVLSHTDDLIVVNKPSSIPCHPCGRYRHNSIVFIVGRQLGCANLRNIYRLDRLTSGVLILGKTTKMTKVLETQVLNRQVEKEYVCRVVGEFPDGKVECKEPLGIVSWKLGLFRVRPDGKASHTTFHKLSYNGKSSVVKCVPHTGRTHQIRVHLQFLGHPIVNDPFYNSEAWGPSKNKGGVMERTDEEISEALTKLYNIGKWTDGENPFFTERMKEMGKAEESPNQLTASPHPSDRLPKETEGAMDHCSDDCGGDIADTQSTKTENPEDCIRHRASASGLASGQGFESKRSKSSEISSSDISRNRSRSCEEPPAKVPKTEESDRTDKQLLPFDSSKWKLDPQCQACRLKFVDPREEDLVMYLHALRYKGPGWEYKTDLPEWAQSDWSDG